GNVQFRRIIANTETTLTLDRPWEPLPLVDPEEPDRNFFYRVSALPEDQTDGVIRGPQVVWSIKEAVGASDTIVGGGGADMIFGGAAGDDIAAGGGEDLVAGDSARVDLAPVEEDG